MSSKSKGKDKKDIWQNISNKVVFGHKYDNVSVFGYLFAPQFGTSTVIGNYEVFGECGMDLIDPVYVQGARIIKNMKIRLAQAVNTVNRNHIVVVYKYNRAYGGKPCCNYYPAANEGNMSLNVGGPTINNYQNVLGQSIFNQSDSTEHVICIDKEIVLESGDLIKISVGNIPMYGYISRSGTEPPVYTQVPEVIDGSIAITATVECAVAYL